MMLIGSKKFDHVITTEPNQNNNLQLIIKNGLYMCKGTNLF